MNNTRIVSRDEIRFALVAEDEPYFSREDEVYECFWDWESGLEESSFFDFESFDK